MATNNPIQLLVQLGINENQSLNNVQSALDRIKTKLNFDINITASGNGAFTSINKEVDNTKKNISDLNKEINKVGTSKQVDFNLSSSFEKESKEVKNIARQLDSYLDRELGEYKLNFVVDKNGVDKLHSVVGTVRNELGGIDKIKYEPEFDITGVLLGLNKVDKTITDLSTKDLDLNINKAISELNRLSREGKVTSEQLDYYLKEVNDSADNMSLNKVMNSLKLDNSTEENYKKFVSVVSELDKVLRKLEDTGEVTKSQLDRFKANISNLDYRDISTANALLSNMKDKLADVNRNIKLADGIDSLRMNFSKLDSNLIRTEQLYKKTFDKEKATALRSELEKLQNVQINNPVQLKNAQREYDVLREKVRMFGAESTLAARSSMGLFDSFSVAMKRFPVWMAASTIFYGVARGVKDLTNQVIELDSAMTDLHRVMDIEEYKFNDMLEQSLVNVKDLSGNAQDYLKLVGEFGRTGMDDKQSMAMANTATLLQNISELSADEAFDSLTAAMISFNIAAEDSKIVADSLNEVDNNFAITTKDLSLSMNKATSTAATFGVSLDQLLGYTTAIGAATRESGNIVGNSLKTIFSRITTNDTAISALDDVGISIKDIEGNVRPVADIIDELGGKWNKLSDAQRQNTAVGVAGVYQLSRFNGLMLNYDMAIQATETSMNSFNSSSREQEKYSQSLEARINQLQTAWTSFAQTAGDSIIYDSIVVVTSALEGATDGSNKLASAVGILAPVFGMLGVSAFALSGSLRGLITSTIAKANADIVATGATGAHAIAMTGLSVASRLATGALRGLLLASGVGAVFAVLGLAIEKVVGAMSDMIQAQEEFEAYTKTNISALTENKQKTDELLNSYEALRDEKANGTWDSTKEQEYLQVQQQLSEIFPAIVDNIDSTGQAHLKNRDAIEEEIESAERLAKAKARTNVSNAEDSFKKSSKENTSLKGQKEGLESTLQLKVDRGASQSELDKLDYEILSLEERISDSSFKIKGDIEQLINDILLLNDIKLDDNLSSMMNSFLNGVDTSKIDNDKEKLADFAKEFGQIQIDLQRAVNANDSKGIESAVSALNKLEKKTEGSDKNLQNFKFSYDDLTTTVKNGNIVLTDAEENVDGVGASAEESADKLKDLTDSISYINGVLEDYSENGKLSEESMMGIIEKYPELISYLNDEAGMVDALKKKKQEEIDIANDALNEKLFNDSTYYEKSKDKLQEFLDIYGKKYGDYYDGDLDKFTNLATAKLSIESELIMKLAKKWSLYYNEVEKAFMKVGQVSVVEEKELGMVGGGIDVGSKEQKRIDELTKRYSDIQNAFENFSLDTTFDTIGTSIDKTSSKADKSNSTTKESIYITDAYKQALENLNLAIEKQQKLQDKFPKYSNEYRKALEEQIKLEKQKLALQEKQAKTISSQISSGKIQQTGSVSFSNTSTTSGGSTQAKVWDYFKAKGLNENAVAGIMGNIAQESNFNTSAVNSIGASGLFQWLGGRKNGLLSYAKSLGKSWTDLQVQLDYAWKELNGKENATLQAMQKSGYSASQYASIFESKFERSGGSAVAKRQSNAVKYYNQFAGSGNSVTLTGAGAIDNTQQAIDDAKSTLNSLQVDILNQQALIEELGTKIIESQLDSFDHQRTLFDENFTYEENKIKNVDKFSERYNKTIMIQAGLLDKKKKSYQDELNYVNSLLAKGGLSATLTDELTSKQMELKGSIQETISQAEKLKLSRVGENEIISEQQAQLIEYTSKVLETLSIGSDRYNATLKKNTEYMKEKLRADENQLRLEKMKVVSGAYSGEALESITEKVRALTLSTKDLSKQIQDNDYEIIVSIKTKYDEKVDDFNYELDKSKILQSFYKEGSSGWDTEAEKQLTVLSKIKKTHEESYNSIKSQLTNSQLTPEDIKNLTETLEEESLAILNTSLSIEQMKESIKSTHDTLSEDMYNKAIDSYKSYLNERQDEHLKSIDDELKAEEKLHNERVKMLNDEMELYRKNVQEKLDDLDRQESERGYNMEIDDLESQRNKLQEQIDRLSLDTSNEAKAKRKKAQEELDKIDKDIAERRHDRDIELQKQSLNDNLATKEEEISNREELENESYDTFVETKEREREYWQKYYTDLLNDERKFAQLREDIMNGNFSNISSDFQGYISEMEATMPKLQDTLDGTMQAVGTSIRQNVIDNLREAISTMNEFTSSQSNASGSGLKTGNTDLVNDTYNPNANKDSLITDSENRNNPQPKLSQADMKVILAKYMKEQLANLETNDYRKSEIRRKADLLAAEGRSEGSEIEVMKSINNVLGEYGKEDLQMFSSFVSANKNVVMSDYLQTHILEFSKRIASMDTGGYINTTGQGLDGKGGALSIVHPNEVILNKVDTKSLIDGISIMDRIKPVFASIMQNFQKPTSLLSTVDNASSISVTLTGDIYNSNGQTGRNLGEGIVNAIKNKGGRI